MNKYLKSFLHRGLVFGGFGPLVTAVVFLIISFFEKDLVFGASEVFVAMLSTYLLAFVHAGASVFTGIEDWPIAKCIFFHFGTLYPAYTVCYLINSWIEFRLDVFIIYTLVFVLVYFIVWLAVLISLKALGKKINSKLGKE